MFIKKFSNALSKHLSVMLDNKLHVRTRFAILPVDTPTLLSLPTIKSLQLTLHPTSNTVKSRGQIFPCNISEVVTPAIGTHPIDTLPAHGSIESAVKTKSTAWSSLLTTSQKQQAEGLLMDFADTWFEPKAGCCTTVTMEIKVEGQPKRSKARPTPVQLRSELNKQINDLLAAGVISPAQTMNGSPHPVLCQNRDQINGA